MMLKRFGWYAIACLLLFAHGVSAQTETPTAQFSTFPVEQRCIAPPTQPPSDWTYPGMILMSGYAGIHAMQADWDTPHVVAFLSQDSEGNEPLDGGQLSPNQNWYAVPMGERYTEVSNNVYFFVNGIRVYSLSDDRSVIDIKLSDYRNVDVLSSGAWTYFPIQWRDNESFIIGGLLLHPFAGTGEKSDFAFVASTFELPPVFSPDLTRVFGSGVFFNYSIVSGFYNPFEPNRFHKVIGGLDGIYWRRDSSGFIAYLRRESENWYGLAYYDHDGELQERVLQLDEVEAHNTAPFSGRSDLGWSPTGNYFAYSDPRTARIYIVDWQNRVVLDTCLTGSGSVWSPDGAMLAYLSWENTKMHLIVVDIKMWQAYIVAFPTGGPIGWRDTSEDRVN